MRASAGARASARPGLGGAIKLAHLLSMSEREFEERVRRLEADPLFTRMIEGRAVRVEPYAARLAARKPDGRELSAAGSGLGALLDGRSAAVELVQRVGQERFEEFFLADAALPDERRAQACGLSVEEVRVLRELVDQAYIQAEFADPAAPAPARTLSVVAGIELGGGVPVIALFQREAWKGRYRVDGGRLAALRQGLPLQQARRLDALVSQLELLDRRKTTLYKALEVLVERQRDYLSSGDPARRRPLPQRAVAGLIDVAPSLLNRLVSNKCVRLPWGLEAPLKALMPSRKSLLIERVDELVAASPRASDERLRGEVERLYGARLSRRSIAQYRKDLGLLRRTPPSQTNIMSHQRA